jgi:thiol-disulfide isomerase/thioredoxin
MSVIPEPGPIEPRRGRLTLIFVVLVAVGLAGSTMWSQLRPPTEGPMRAQPAPEVSVMLLNGERFLLSEHLSRYRQPVVLNLWASWCEPCRSEVPELDRFAADHPEITVLGLAVDDTMESVTNFLNQTPAQYPIAVESGRRIADSYQVTGLPATMIIGPDGIVRHHLLGEVSSATLQRLLP